MPAQSITEKRALDLFEKHLQQFLTQQTARDPVGHQIRYHFGVGQSQNARRGKRLRPRLVMAAATAYGGKPEQTLAVCAAIELLHNYSLVHDDIEDGDRLRHGRETLWAAFGLPHGINTGDAIGALAQLALSESGENFGAHTAFCMTMELARAHFAMCEGQALDLALEAGTPASIDAYLEMIECKTAALFSCAAALGARCATADEREIDRCRSIGRLFGLGFQIDDDVLGIWGNTSDTGKVAAGDLERRKKTFPIAWAIQHDPVGAGRAIAKAFGKARKPSDEAVGGLRIVLEECGAYRAARSTADNYFESAHRLAQGLQPLSDFVLQWRSTA